MSNVADGVLNNEKSIRANHSPAATTSRLGQHNEEILRDLGLTDDELQNLRARHAIGETALSA